VSNGDESVIIDLRSLGIDTRRKSELNNREELLELAENLKQSMLHDYKIAYGHKGDEYEQESKATLCH
jgi:hypothetical protein